MRLELSNGVNSLIDINHNEPKKTLSGRMPYVTVRENAVKWWITVQGLNHHEVRLLAEKVSDQPESHNDKEKMAEFSVPSWQVRNS